MKFLPILVPTWVVRTRTVAIIVPFLFKTEIMQTEIQLRSGAQRQCCFNVQGRNLALISATLIFDLNEISFAQPKRQRYRSANLQPKYGASTVLRGELKTTASPNIITNGIRKSQIIQQAGQSDPIQRIHWKIRSPLQIPGSWYNQNRAEEEPMRTLEDEKFSLIRSEEPMRIIEDEKFS